MKGVFLECLRNEQYCGPWEQHEFEISWAAKVRHIRDHLVEHSGFNETKTPTMADIHNFLQKKFPTEKIPKPTKRVVALDLWQQYSYRF